MRLVLGVETYGGIGHGPNGHFRTDPPAPLGMGDTLAFRPAQLPKDRRFFR